MTKIRRSAVPTNPSPDSDRRSMHGKLETMAMAMAGMTMVFRVMSRLAGASGKRLACRSRPDSFHRQLTPQDIEMKKIKVVGMALVFAGTLALSPFAQAHASLKSSLPAANATLEAAPKDISLTFSEKVEESFSAVALEDAAGKDVTAAKAHIDATDGATLHLDAPLLRSGVYTVRWVAVAHDGHRRTGHFKFTVK
jgi:methionine-rich copper-binding protein CopC